MPGRQVESEIHREKQQERSRNRCERAKMVDVMCIEFQRSTEEGEKGGNASNEHTSTTTTTDASSEDESSAAEVQ